MTPHLDLRLLAVGWLAGVGAVGGAAFGQTDPGGVPTGTPRPPFVITFSGGLEYQFDADIDGGGDFNVLRLGFGLESRSQPLPELDLSVKFNYALDAYSFSGPALGVAEQWEDVHTFGLQATASYRASREWTIFGGPILQISRESGADWDNAFTGGAVIGASYAFSEELVMGFGLGVLSQLEDSELIFPVLVLNWKISNDLRLTTQGGGRSATGTGLELIWGGGDGWEFAVGGRYEFRRFRLDNSGDGPGGVGEETLVPFWVRASTQFDDNVTVSAYAGFTLGGGLLMDDENGNRIGKEDYDPAAFLGIFAKVTF